ncbi:MAG: alpha-hydroxy-acid oxidizing protein [Proteobacteria bacterium]|nr:alpha-hydroxy-acid oxidizing protein [Pseudomonadota bacterium]
MPRRYYPGRDFRRALTIEELRRVAARRVPAFAFEYVEGGAEDELALERNRLAFDRWRFVPRTLVNTEGRHARTTLFGREQPLPIVIAPTGVNGMLTRDADLKLARAAARAGIAFTLSTVSNQRPDTVVREAGGRLWMQLYWFRDPAIAADVVRRADAAGYEALVFTSDANVFGHREWDKRSYRGPGQLTLRSVLDVARHPRWLLDVMWPRGLPRFVNVADFFPPEARSARAGVTRIPALFAPTIDWDTVAWLRERWPRRLLVKGILDPADVERAVRLGCDGVVLSNHGGRQLDCTVAALEVLPEIARAFGDRTTILVDGGIRRGSDIAKAVALGAHAVMVARATLYGVAAGGEAGASHALTILASELDRVLGQLGCRSLAELSPAMLREGEPTRRARP